MWQADTTSGYRDLLNKITQAATSQHVSAVAVNAGGTGYIVGEILTVTHAGAAMDCTAEVLTLSGSAVATVKLRNMGAFSNRLASALVNAGGSGYVTGDILEVEGGTERQNAKVSVTAAAGAITSVAIQDGGGAYTVAPGLTGATTNNDPGSGSGTGGTLDLTMTGMIGTTGIATTASASGTGCTLNLTLTETGWTAARDWNNFSYNSLTDEKEVVLEGTVASGDEPYVAFRSYTDDEGVDTRYGFVMFGMTSFNPGLSLASQANLGPSQLGTAGEPYQSGRRAHLVMFDTSQDFWLSFTGRKLGGVIKSIGGSTTVYSPFYLGLGNPFGTVTENPYPMFVAGNCAISNRAPDDGGTEISSFLNPFINTVTSPVFFYRLTDTSWVNIAHSNGISTKYDDHVMYPVGEPDRIANTSYLNYIVEKGAFSWFDGICDPTGQTASRYFYRTPDTGGDIFPLVPVTLLRSTTIAEEDGTDDDIHLELDNIFWCSGTLTSSTQISAEDTFTISGDRYTVFRDCHNDEQYSFFCMKEE